MKQISLKGLADFITAGPAKQKTIVKQYKYPADDEARAKIVYYREARETIEAYHRAGRDLSWLHEQADRLDNVAHGLKSRSRTRLKHNSRGIRDYANNFPDEKFTLLDPIKTFLEYADVRISIRPDLFVKRNNEKYILKLEFSVEEPDDREKKIISQLLYEASEKAKLNIASKNVRYVDVPRGTIYKGARVGSRLVKDIHAACETLSDIWDRV